MEYYCPRCGVKLEPVPQGCNPVESTTGNRFFPFCSDRCQMADLYGWLEEQYRIPAVEQDSESGDDDSVRDSDDDSSDES